ncbi:MAG: MFS transporter [Hyphomicrobiales bacterium]|nr:MFS transporter [Hyphomicrobiales bacterium]MCP5000738.1 MFS transporter [Hyphomicrobiales bacterium]
MVIVQGPLLARLAKTASEKMLVTGGGLILAPGFVLLVWDQLTLIYPGAILIALGNGLMWPTGIVRRLL